MNKLFCKISIIFITLSPTMALAESQIISTSSILKMLAVLLFIVGLIFLLNKVANKQFSKLGNGQLKVISSIPVGQKERLVLVEASGEKILVGVAQGVVRHISNIHTNKKFEMIEDE
jgi:flagellar protein FliO/FliZ